LKSREVRDTALNPEVEEEEALGVPSVDPDSFLGDVVVVVDASVVDVVDDASSVCDVGEDPSSFNVSSAFVFVVVSSSLLSLIFD